MNAIAMIGRCMIHQDPDIAAPPLSSYVAVGDLPPGEYLAVSDRGIEGHHGMADMAAEAFF